MAQQAPSRSVGRPREFDEDAALEAAMEAFWAKGYEATSMADLCACTGLHKGSLYQAFGDKHALFMSALKHYADTEFRDVAEEAFRSESPLENIRAAVRKICDMAAHEKGCLMINSVVELAPHDDAVKAAVQGFAKQRLDAMTHLIAQAQKLGEIRLQQPPERLARQLMITLAGAATLVKGMIQPEDAQQSVEDLIASWE